MNRRASRNAKIRAAFGIEKMAQSCYRASMFNATEIKKLMDAKPFQPFRLCMSDGKTHEVKNHDAALITRNFIEVGINPDREGILASIDRLAIIHIVRIEDLQPA